MGPCSSRSTLYGLLHRLSLRAHLGAAHSDLVFEALEANISSLAHIRRAVDCFYNTAGMALRRGCARRDTNNGTCDLNDQLLRPVDHGGACRRLNNLEHRRENSSRACNFPGSG